MKIKQYFEDLFAVGYGSYDFPTKKEEKGELDDRNYIINFIESKNEKISKNKERISNNQKNKHKQNKISKNQNTIMEMNIMENGKIIKKKEKE